MYAKSYLRKRRIVVALERIEVIGAHLGRAVAAPEVVLKEYRHLLHHGGAAYVGRRSYLQCSYEVLLAVGSHLAYRQLRTGYDYRLVKILEHKRQRRGRIGHGVGSVKHHKTVKAVKVVLNRLGYLHPALRIHVRRIDGRLKLYVLDSIIEHLYLRHIVDQVPEVKGLQRMSLRILNHSDCSSGVDYQYIGFAFTVHR